MSGQETWLMSSSIRFAAPKEGRYSTPNSNGLITLRANGRISDESGEKTSCPFCRDPGNRRRFAARCPAGRRWYRWRCGCDVTRSIGVGAGSVGPERQAREGVRGPELGQERPVRRSLCGSRERLLQGQGIDAEIISGGPGIDSINLVASKHSMLGDRDSTNIILARSKGIPIKAFAAALQKNPYSMMSLKSKPVRNLQDMAGKTIAIPLRDGRR